MAALTLKHGLDFPDHYRRYGLVDVDTAIITHLAQTDVALHNRHVTARREAASLDRKAESDLLTDLAPHLEDFIGELFGITKEVRALQARHDALAPLYSVKRLFVQRRAVKGVSAEAAAAENGEALAEVLARHFGEPFSEESFARQVARWMEDEGTHGEALTLAARYAAWATLAPEGQK